MTTVAGMRDVNHLAGWLGLKTPLPSLSPATPQRREPNQTKPNQKKMNTLKNMMSSNNNNSQQPSQQQPQQHGIGGWSDKINTLAGGGHASEQNEDALDKGPPLSPSPPHKGSADVPSQALISCRSTSSGRARRTTRARSSRRRTRRSVIVCIMFLGWWWW